MDFLLVGQRVILNPESSAYKHYNERVNGCAGYIVDMVSNDNDMINLIVGGPDRVKNWYVLVQFDNDERIEVQIKNLLPIESPLKDFARIRFKSIGAIYLPVEELDDLLDEQIIINKENPYNKKIYNQEWREFILKEIERKRESF